MRATLKRFSARWLIGVALVATGLSACRSRNPPPEIQLVAVSGDTPMLAPLTISPPSPSTTAASPRPSPQQPTPPARPRLSIHTVASGDRARRYLLVAPATLATGRAYPLVLYFHGDGGDGEGMHRGIPFEQASGDDAIVAYPDGINHTWDLETRTGNKDIAFVEVLIEDVASAFSIDRTRIFASGYSNGGFFANVLACHRGSLIRAIASNAGGAPYGQAESWPNQFTKCPGQQPVAAIALHGEDDNGVTLDSGRFSAEYWAYVNGCTMTEMEPTAYSECRAYRGCRPGKDVVFCKVPGLGHWVWDRASEASWRFFQREAP